MEWEKRNAKGHARYMFKFNDNEYADCFEAYRLGFCIMNYGDSLDNLVDNLIVFLLTEE